jgi:hypothetical protein
VNPTRKTLIVPMAALASWLVCAGAASAQERGRERGAGDRQSGQSQAAPQRGAVPRSRESRVQAPPPRVQQSQAPQAQAPQVQQAPTPRQDPRIQNVPRFQNGQRSQDAPRVQQNAPRFQQNAPRFQNAPRVAPDRQGSYNSAPYRQQAPSRVSPQSRSYSGGGAVPRTYQAPGYSNRTYGYSRESYWPRLRSSFYAPRFFYSASLYRPYYDFRPRLRLGLGIYLGYPVAYPSWYDPYLSTAYSWYRPGISYGGVSFDIQPVDAEIFVDGDYVGVVQDFGPYAAPLTLPAGTHHIDLQSDGFEPLSFDITVVPQQVIPYQGTLPR